MNFYETNSTNRVFCDIPFMTVGTTATTPFAIVNIVDNAM